MKCCNTEYPDPHIVDGTAHFICSVCWETREIKNYREYTEQESIDDFEKEYGVKLPNRYLELLNKSDCLVAKVPSTDIQSLKFYFGEGFYTLGEISGLNKYEYRSLFDSSYLSETWGLPDNLVLLDGDGHTWLSLDYRESAVDPKVILIESDECNSLVIADNFEEFISRLIPYEKVYDREGNIIYDR